jgi:hypothetical protein
MYRRRTMLFVCEEMYLRLFANFIFCKQRALEKFGRGRF